MNKNECSEKTLFQIILLISMVITASMFTRTEH